MSVAFSPATQQAFEKLVAKYETRRSALLPTLYLAQNEFGYLKPEVMDYVAELIGIPRSQVYEAAHFYTMFKKRDLGQWCLQVCTNITCTLMGADALLKVVHEELGLKPGGVTEDRAFSLVPVQCLGSCDTAPVCQVNEEYVERLTPETFRDMIRALRRGEIPDAVKETAV